MISPLHRRVLSTLRRYNLVRAGERLGVAVSGGADSVALLKILEDLRGTLGVTLCVLHFNHGLRGAESDADETFVEGIAHKSNLQFFRAGRDVAAAAKQHGWNLEDAGRRLRIEFFAEAVRQGSAMKIATAHTADDQAETVLARIVRGSGIKGLGSIQPKMNFIIRPLLDVRRQELRQYLSDRGQNWCEDASNQDLRQLRARLRHRLMPQLEESFSPAIVERLCMLSGLARDEDTFWDALLGDRVESLVEESSSRFSIRANDLLSPMQLRSAGISSEKNPALTVTQRLIRRLHTQAAGAEAELSRKDVDRVIELAAKGHSGKYIELPAGVRVAREFDRVVFCRKGTETEISAKQRRSPALLSYEYQVHLPIAGAAHVSIPELGRSLSLKLIDCPMIERETTDCRSLLDAERLSSPLVIRNWRPGDAYRPQGRRRDRKLKELFLSSRVSVTERALWPVLTSAGRVVWARRMPVAAEFSVSGSTRIGLEITDEG